MHRPIAAFSLALAILHVGPAIATADTADDYAATGRTALEHGKYPEALSAYRRAYDLDPTSLRALFVAIASSYAQVMSASIDDLEAWLVRKKAEATAAGDSDTSWAKLTDLIKAYRAAAARAERKYVTEHTEVEKLTIQNKALTDNVGRLKTELDQVRFDRDRLLHIDELHDPHDPHNPP